MRSFRFTLVVALALSMLFPMGPVMKGDSGMNDASGTFVYGNFGSRLVTEDSWPMYMGEPMHNGYTSSPIPMENNTDILWGTRVDNLLGTVSPVVSDGVVYIGSGNGHMLGFDIDTGEKVWDVYIGNYRIRSSAAIDSGRIYFGADNGHLYVFDITTRAKLLDVDLDGAEIESSPLIIGNRAYIGVNGPFLRNNRFHSVDLDNGTINWTVDMGDLENFYGFRETAAYYNGYIYIGDGTGTFYCLDKDGFWDGNDGPFTSEANTSLSSPDIVWVRKGQYSISTDAMIAEGRVYYGTIVGKLYCVDASTGDEIWNRTVGLGDRAYQSCPTFRNGRVFVTARNSVGAFDGASVYCLNADDGKQIWRFNISAQIITESSPILVDGGVVFGARNHKVYCLSTVEENIADEDRILWMVNTGSPITSTPAISNGRIFVANEPYGMFGKLFAIGAPDPSIEEVWMSDPSPFIGERVGVFSEILNNATVDCRVTLEFRASTINNSRQEIMGILEDIPVPHGEATTVHIDWNVKSGFDFIALLIKEVTPEDRNPDNNLGTIDLYQKTPLTDSWTSSGSGPEMDGGGGEALESNRSFWEIDLGSPWSGPPGSMWYDTFDANGTLSTTGAGVYLCDPSGNLVAYSTTPSEDGSVELLWKYSNSSVDLVGRPLLLVDSEMFLGGPNRAYAYGDDGALWAFDWMGFLDGKNDGPFTQETGTGAKDGDVVWRTPLPSPPARPLIAAGGNIIAACEDGSIRGVDDDSGTLLWSIPYDIGGSLLAADMTTLFLSRGNMIRALDPNTGETLRTMNVSSMGEDVNITSMAVTDRGLLLTSGNQTVLMDADPSDGVDEGMIDGSPDSDIIWTRTWNEEITGPVTVSGTGITFSIMTGSRLTFSYLENGTEMANLSIPEPASYRVVSGGDSYYVVTGSSPWILRAFSPTDVGSMEPTWTLRLSSSPRGELVVAGDHMFITLSEGRVISLGKGNNRPVAVVASPLDGILLFPGENVTLDASGSMDADGDPLTYVWTLEGEEEPIYEGASAVVEASLQGIGKRRLVLRVYDDMRAFGEASVNITLLRRITYPPFEDVLYDLRIDMSYGISEPSGRGLVNVSIPQGIPDAPGSVFSCSIEFIPLPVYASYRFEWANISIGFRDKEFPVGMNPEKMGVFFYDETNGVWVRAPHTGLIDDQQRVWGNFSSIRPGFYALGILDNSIPELRHSESRDYRYRMIDSTEYIFRVEYRDADNDIPVRINLVMDNRTSYDLLDEGFATTVTRWTFFSVSDVPLSPGTHSYYFEADDSNFNIRSPYYQVIVGNNPPVPRIVGPTSIVRTGETVLFDGSGSYDPDGDEITFSWDFDARDGIQRDKVDPKVDHVYYDEGNYIVTLTVSDGVDTVSRTLSITVVGSGSSTGTGNIPIELWIGIMIVMGVLIIAIMLFIIISRRGHEEQSDLQRRFEGRWTCPECGARNPNGVEECSNCDYIYDPMDFEEEE